MKLPVALRIPPDKPLKVNANIRRAGRGNSAREWDLCNRVIVAAGASGATIALRHPILINLHMDKGAGRSGLVNVPRAIAHSHTVIASPIDRLVKGRAIPSLVQIVLKRHVVHLNESPYSLAAYVCNTARWRERPLERNASGRTVGL